jgi:ferredoxin
MALFLACLAPCAGAVDRFPRPEFEGSYVLPASQNPLPCANIWAYVDVLLLVAALAAASYFALRQRSRAGMIAITCFSVAYFGWWRRGCVCAVGSLQNVSLALFDKSYAIPITVLLFFLLPLIFAAFFGRVFCAAVCPLGAVQELLVIKPVRVPNWLSKALGLGPYLYLGLAVLLAATGAGFVVCQFDPFVALFRLGGHAEIWLLSLCIIVLGFFVARPYCRFVCPYGVILNWFSRLAKWHLAITPDTCIQCRLCESACPYGAIMAPTEARATEPRSVELRRLTSLLLLIPVLIVVGGWCGAQAAPVLSRAHATVQLARQLAEEERNPATPMTLQSETFRATGTALSSVYADADNVVRSMRRGGWLLGGFMGAAVGVTLVRLAVRRRRHDYEPDRGTCVSCGRCFAYCPMEHARRQRLISATS